MNSVLTNMFSFMNSFSLGDYFFLIGTFLLIVLFIYIIYLLKTNPNGEEMPKVKDDFDLVSVSRSIEENYKPEPIKLTPYEEEQENNAIISYEELVKNKDRLNVGYDDEYLSPTSEFSVRKFDLEKTGNYHIEEPKIEVKLISYEKEEEFLKALKELQAKLI